jgi:hypothetical protein
MGSMENGHSVDRQFGTLAVHAGAPHDPSTGAVIAPVSPSIEPHEEGVLISPRSLCRPPMLRLVLETPLVTTSTLAALTPTGKFPSSEVQHTH